MENNTKLTFGNKLAFAVADLFGGGSFNIVNFLYPGFLALAVGLSPFWISFIMFIARVWDAVSDPLMGRISDATKNKRFGKRRVYLVIAAPLVVVAMFLMFYPFSMGSEIVRVLCVLFSYIFFSTVQTMIMIPYSSLSSELAYDYKDRASANSLRLAFSIFSSILCVAVPGMIVGAFDGNDGYIVMSLIFGSIFGLSVLMTGLFTREQIVSPPIKRAFRFDEFTRFLKVRPFRQYLGMLLTLQMTMAIMSSLFFFYIDFYINRDITAAGGSSVLGLIGAGGMFATQIVALPFYLWLIGKKNKAFAYRFGAFIWIIAAVALFTLQPGVPDIAIIIAAVVIGFGISGPGLVPHAMFGDVVDACEVVTGERGEGAMSGFVNFLNKIAQAVGLSAVMAALGFFGFQEQVAGAAKVVSQPETAQTAIRAIICFAPLFLMTFGILISFKYKIDMKKQSQVRVSIENGDNSTLETLKKEFT